MKAEQGTRLGLLARLRTSSRGLYCCLIVALLAAAAMPPVAHAGAAGQRAADGAISICTGSGNHYEVPDGTPSQPPTDPLGSRSHDCCTANCHPQIALLPIAISVATDLHWFVQPLDRPRPCVLVPASYRRSEPRGPPLSL